MILSTVNLQEGYIQPVGHFTTFVLPLPGLSIIAIPTKQEGVLRSYRSGFESCQWKVQQLLGPVARLPMQGLAMWLLVQVLLCFWQAPLLCWALGSSSVTKLGFSFDDFELALLCQLEKIMTSLFWQPRLQTLGSPLHIEKSEKIINNIEQGNFRAGLMVYVCI